MKRIRLVVAEGLDYKQELIAIVEGAHAGQGITTGELAGRINLLRRLRGADGVLVLENAEHETLCGLLESARWGRATEAVLTMVTAVKDAKEQLAPLPDVAPEEEPHAGEEASAGRVGERESDVRAYQGVGV